MTGMTRSSDDDDDICWNCCASMSRKCRSRQVELKDFSVELNDLCQHHQTNVKHKLRQMCTVDALKQRLPVLKWIPKYRYKHVISSNISPRFNFDIQCDAE